MTVVGGPSPDYGVELADQQSLRQGFPTVDDPSKLRKMILHLGLGRFDQGFAPETPMAPRAFPRLGFAHPILPDVTPQQRQPRLIAFQGVAHVTFGLVEAESDVRQPRLEQLLAVLKHLAILVQHHTVIGIGDDPSVRGDLGDGLLHPMQRDQSQERRTAAALWHAGRGGRENVLFQEARLEPGFELSADDGRRLRFGQ
jgi:hypothetical protein